MNECRPNLLRTIGLAALSAVFFSACAGQQGAADAAFQSLFVAKDAASLRTDRIGSGEQISFLVDRSFPEIDLTGARLQVLRDANWLVCTGRRDQWQSFVDQTGGAARLIHQRILFFRKDAAVVMYAARYRSSVESDATGVDRTTPQSGQQHVVIQRMDLGDPNVKLIMDSFGTTC